VWAMSPGEAVDAVLVNDAALVNVDAREKSNVRVAPARVEEIGREPEAEDVKATNAGWRFGRLSIAAKMAGNEFAQIDPGRSSALSRGMCARPLPSSQPTNREESKPAGLRKTGPQAGEACRRRNIEARRPCGLLTAIPANRLSASALAERRPLVRWARKGTSSTPGS
jgi:hypothetical protein